MLQRVLIAALLPGFAVMASAAIGQQAVTSPFQLKFDASGKIPYSAALVKELLADAKMHGDARRGAVVFRAATSACLSCHKVGKQGGEVGPSLSAVGICIPPEEIVEGVFWPNRTVKPEFKAVAVEVANGQVMQGIVKDETARELVLQDVVGKPHRIPIKEIAQRREIGTLMPEGLTAAMTAEQRRDLIRYLLDLGKTPGLDHLHEPVTFAYSREPLRPEDWPNRKHHVNRDRVYDFYTREAVYFRSQKPLPLLLPEWPGIDGGTFGHWGNQNDNVWKDNRWNQTDLGSLQCGVFRADKVTVPRGVCVRLGDNGELAACFNPDTLQIEALWPGGFVRFSDRRFGFIEGIRPAGQLLPTPAKNQVSQPFVYRGFYRHGTRTIFAYRVGGVELLDAPWVENGKFVREVAPADKHSLAHLTGGGKAQWPQVVTTTGSLGTGRPYAVDTIAPPLENPWKALMHFGGHDFFADGSAAICTMQGDVWHVEGLDGTLKNVRWRRIASGLHHALGGQVYVSSQKWGPLQGQRVHLSFGTATHFLLLRDEVEGQAQGAIVPLVGDFGSGVQRGRFHPRDGQLYVSGMAGWGTYAAADGCFQRVRYTGDPVQLPRRFHVYRNGVLVEFTQALDRTFVEKAEHHFAQCWNYRFSSGYGSREFSPSHYGLPGHDPVPIASVHLLADGRPLFVEMPDLQPVNQLHLNLGIAKGRTCDLFITLHKLDKPFRELPNYRETTRPLAPHPILKDLAFAAKRVPNPWQKPIPKAREVRLEAGKNLTFATPTIRVQAGEALRLTFTNPDVVPHNWVLVKPGMLKPVGEMANRLIADPDAVVRNYVPIAKEVLVYTDVVPPQGTTAIHFRVPRERGRYPFLCTFPGHWMVMNGEMLVE